VGGVQQSAWADVFAALPGKAFAKGGERKQGFTLAVRLHMRKFFVGAALVAAVSVPAAAQEAGPVTSGHGSVFAGPYVGFMKFGELADLGGETEYSNEDGLFYGAQLGYSFNPNIALLGNLGYSKSKFVIKDPDGTGGATTQDVSGDLGVFFYDANLQLKLPFALGVGSSSIAPFVQGGVGQTKYTADYDDLNGEGTTSTTFNVGLGADFQLARSLGLRLMVKDYITSLDWSEFGDVRFQDNRENNVANNIAFTAGLNFGF
jgi:opacity protein-like surface antigen